MSLKSKFKITKVRRVLKFEGTERETYIVWKVTGPRKVGGYFVTRKDATEWVRKYTSRIA